jgi:hypothetical protein
MDVTQLEGWLAQIWNEIHRSTTSSASWSFSLLVIGFVGSAFSPAETRQVITDKEKRGDLVEADL